MGATKTDQYSDMQQSIAKYAKALGHPARVAIIEYLLKVNTCICNNIVDELPLAQPTVSQHLKALKDADLIIGEIEGNSICYCININAVEVFRNYIALVVTKHAKKKNSCC